LVAETAAVATIATTTATATATTAASKATTTATATTSGPVTARTSLADIQCAAIEFLAVQTGNSGLTLSVISHFDERETPGATGVSVGDDADFRYLTESLKLLAKFILADSTRQVANVDVHLNLLVCLSSHGF
jgi:hypothetical protein